MYYSFLNLKLLEDSQMQTQQQSVTLELGTRVRIRPLPDIHKFLHGATGMIIPAPSQHVLRDRKFVRFDNDIAHPYGGVMRSIWVDESMVEVVP
jgi:hypothetical protein